MASKPSSKPYGGTVVERRRKTDVYYGLRFTAYGRRRYQKLGPRTDGWTRKRAEEELQNVMADVRRGIWKPPPPKAAAPPEPPAMPTFHEFSTKWIKGREQEGGRTGRGLSRTSLYNLHWRLEVHLLPYFAEKRLDAIRVEDVDDYRRRKVAAGRLSPSSVNGTISTLAAILEQAVEYDLIAKNPAKGKHRRVKADPPRRTWIDRADHIDALLVAAGELDAEARGRRGQRRALLTTLAFAGLRLGEALALAWRDVDLARGTITVRTAKTDAGERVIDLLPVLREQLTEYRATLGDVAPSALVFGSGTGAVQQQSNVRRRILAPAVARANKQLVKAELEPLPAGLTPHSLRRTFASILVAVGDDPTYVMGQLGHTDPGLTLRIYSHQMRRRDGERERLRALVNGEELAPAGTRALSTADATVEAARV
jgi:integrase